MIGNLPVGCARAAIGHAQRAAEQRDELAPFSFDHLVGAGEKSAARRGRAPWRS